MACESRSALGKLTAVLALATAAVLPAGASAMTQTEEEFCARRVLRDYAAPLADLPQVREPPRSRKLPFAPRRLNFSMQPLFPWAQGHLIVEGDGILYGISVAGRAYGGLRLGWDIESQLVQVDRNGRNLRVAKLKRQQVGLLKVGDPMRIGFGQSPHPGLYRYDILFHDRTGKLLGHYHQYYVVLHRNLEARMALIGTSFRVGDDVLAKIENPGTVPVYYGAGFEIDRFEGGAWVRVPFEDLFGYPNVVPAIGLGTLPGTSSACDFNSFTVPEGMAPGLYRMVKEVGIGQALTAEFTVLPPA